MHLGRALQERGHRPALDRILSNAVNELAPIIGIKQACRHMGRSRATHDRHNQPPLHGPPRPRPRSHRALDPTEQTHILQTLNSERFFDLAPPQIWAQLLDEGTYLCSISTMYRLLRQHHQIRDRGNQRRHPAHIKPELVATAPNQVWSWDITKLAGPHKWNWYHLYVMLDVYPRLAVGWLVAPRESARLAEEFINDCATHENIQPGQLANIHQGWRIELCDNRKLQVFRPDGRRWKTASLPSAAPTWSRNQKRRRRGYTTVRVLVRKLYEDGHTVWGRVSKVVSDALRWEIRNGRVRRLRRGVYSTDRIPSSTRHRIRARSRRPFFSPQVVAIRRDALAAETPPRSLSPDRYWREWSESQARSASGALLSSVPHAGSDAVHGEE